MSYLEGGTRNPAFGVSHGHFREFEFRVLGVLPSFRFLPSSLVRWVTEYLIRL